MRFIYFLVAIVGLVLLSSCDSPVGVFASIGREGEGDSTTETTSDPADEPVDPVEPEVIPGVVVVEPETFGQWNTWEITEHDRVFTDAAFTISGNVFFSYISNKGEKDKIEINVNDENGSLFGARFLSNDVAHRWSAFLGEDLGSSSKDSTNDDIWDGGVDVPFVFSYDGFDVIKLFVGGIEVLSYQISDVGSGITITVTIVERSENIQVELRDIFLDDEFLGTFKTR